MENNKPSPIKEYYIAYFDILGYKAFFAEAPKKANEFLNIVNSAITNTLTTINTTNTSPLASQFANIHIQSKIFSDNVLLCIEVGDDVAKENSRIIAFMAIINAIQRGFITECGLFLRGGFTKGKMSINDDYIFGEGLIKAVELEEKTVHPRIAVSDEIIDILNQNALYSQEELDKAITIENSIKNGDSISDDDSAFYGRILQLNNQFRFERNMVLNFLYMCDDGVICLSYLYCFDVRSFIPEQAIGQALEMMKQISPSDFDKLSKSFPNIDLILHTHKQIVEQKLIKHSDYSSIETKNIKLFDAQERVLRKFVWSMVYHNYMCNKYNKPEHYINTQGNCERRHMKLVIHVIDKEGKIINP